MYLLIRFATYVTIGTGILIKNVNPIYAGIPLYKNVAYIII